ncbi:MAG: diadenylate cyclase CdaA [Bacteroidales bacterium]|nr:diadenylate cyclase CdaA [Bacteroidales bacterium]
MVPLIINAFIELRLFDIIDILLVASLLYGLYYLLRGTVAINIFMGIVAVFMMWKVVTALQMELLGDILGAFVSVGFIALIIIFQPEIRQFLLALGTTGFIKRFRQRLQLPFFKSADDIQIELDVIAKSCVSMASKYTGALIVITRQNGLYQASQTGVQIDAELSEALIENIFFKNTPLHDGAMIISQNRIMAAGCILPVTKKLDLPDRPGLRHRAGLGITEQSDALAIVVSEETGKISIANNGRIYQVDEKNLLIKLKNELRPII